MPNATQPIRQVFGNDNHQTPRLASSEVVAGGACFSGYGHLSNAGINGPLYVYVTHCFDRHGGTAPTLLGSGSSVSAAILRPIFVAAEARIGWRTMMPGLAALQFVPMAALIFAPAPEIVPPTVHRHGSKPEAAILGLYRRWRLDELCTAGLLCCVPSDTVAFRGDMGIAPSEATAMLSVLLGRAFANRQLWAYLAARVGGLGTVLAGSAC